MQVLPNHSFSEPCSSSPVRPGTERNLASVLLSGLFLSLIATYQRLISPLLGPHCRYHPSCSNYAAQAIRSYGPLRGSMRAVARLARCHPLSEGGYDPVR